MRKGFWKDDREFMDLYKRHCSDFPADRFGILLRKWNVADEVFGQKATTLVFRLVLPVMIFHDIATSNIGNTFDGRLFVFAVISVVAMFFGVFLLKNLGIM